MRLIIGNKNYSSWSLRAWLMASKAGLSFDETKLPLDTQRFYCEIAALSPTRKVPTLIDDEITVWDSLAICEYINDTYLSGSAWPSDPQLKATARAISAEMHAGFNAVRSELPMNIRATRQVTLSPDALKDIERIDQIWSERMLAHKQGAGWLFGSWSIADMMFAPVVLRFKTYQIELSDKAAAYRDFLLQDANLKAWIEEALIETEIVEMDEAGTDIEGGS